MSRYCPDCGDSHECAAESTRGDADARVRIAEIEARRDVRIAELRAAETRTEADAMVDIAESEAVAEAAHADGIAEGMTAVVEAAAPEPPAEPEAAPPVIVEPAEPAAPSVPEPPETEHHHREPKKAPVWGFG